MEMQQVRYFAALCDTLNFTRAAERCHVSQPSLTRAIKLLEDELGGPLFHRERNNTHLTELGREVEPHLRRVAEATMTARAQAGAFARLSAPVLRLGVARGVALAVVAAILERFAHAHPGAEIVLPSAEPAELMAMLRRGDLELIVVPRQSDELDDCHHYHLVRDVPQLVLPAAHRLAQQPPVPVRELANETLICVESCPYWPALAELLSTGGRTPKPQLLVSRPLWLLEAVRSGFGIGVMSRFHPLPDGLVGLTVKELPDGPDLSLVTKRGRLYSPPARAFVELALAPRRERTETSPQAA